MVKAKAKKIMECLRCGHKWVNRKDDVRICPYCKSARYDQPREVKK